MPAAREALLDAASAVLARRPWPRVRMVDVAAMSGLSRQTLYNEFGTKEGLGRALVRREADAYLAGIDRVLAAEGDPGERLTAAAEWTVAAARRSALLRALLTGCWSERLPRPVPGAADSGSPVPAQRRADAPLPAPADLLALVRDRCLAALCAPGASGVHPELLLLACEVGMRLALSCVQAPSARDGAGRLVREALDPLLARTV
ncbi:TetR/AcrR family transcriptional regulator [Streptomyces sp. SCSIO ZS0520]|uniref:TetR/AcrR family transcriptional regulator n=1 Tax=Streptomyces sp. SCSIO ZS0520 TaxID=2892996 RepID=UPI0021D99252|nr:TetR/AcrR family transcriptional regulator [Streptomyces sp. SCSIO ZS0520]